MKMVGATELETTSTITNRNLKGTKATTKVKTATIITTPIKERVPAAAATYRETCKT